MVMSVAAEIEKLQALRASGALTDEEFAKAKEAVLNGAPAAAQPQTDLADVTTQATSWLRRLSRSNKDEWIGGVCGGLGESTPLPSWVWRVIFIVGMLSFGVGLIPYIVLWICLPESPPGS
jgi:phage shock protein C